MTIRSPSGGAALPSPDALARAPELDGTWSLVHGPTTTSPDSRPAPYPGARISKSPGPTNRRGSFSVFFPPHHRYIFLRPYFSPWALFSRRRHTEACFRCEAACVRLFLLRCIILGLILSTLCDARPLGLGLSQDQQEEQQEQQEQEEEDVYLVCVVQGSHSIINMVCRRRRRRRRVPTGRERNQWRQRIRQRRQRRRPPTQHRRISPLQQSSQQP